MTAAGVPAWLDTLAAALPGVRGEQLSRFLPPPGEHRHSAVLCLFGDGERGPEVLLIERSATLRSHAGQPAFPGGAVDPEDGPVDDSRRPVGPVRAALREAAEEVGLRTGTVEVLGVLPALWLPPSGFVVHPVVAWWREPHDVAVVDTAEVAAVARVPLADLVDPRNRLQVTHPSGWVGPAFEVHDLMVWGFTAGLLDKLLELGGWAVPWDTGRRRELDADTLALALRSSPRRVDGRPTPEELEALRDAEATGAG